MTAQCGGGASGPKPGVAEFVVYAGDELSTLLGNVKAWYVVALAGLIGVLSYDTLQFCTVDPPSARQLTNAEWNSLLVLDSGFAGALQQLVANIGNQVWWILCQCSTTTTPPPPAFPPAPTGIATGGTGTSFSQCAPGVYSGTGGNTIGQNLSGALMPANDVGPSVAQALAGPSPVLTRKLQFPLPSSYAFDFQTTPNATDEGINGEIIFYDANLIPTRTQGYLFPPGHATHFEGVAIPSNSVYALFITNSNVVSPGVTATVLTISFYWEGNCGVSPNSCCSPTTTDNTAQLAQILTAVRALSVQVGTPLQGYGSFLAGPQFVGRSGNFFLSTTGAVACSIQLTTIPSAIGRRTGNPTIYYDVGWVTSGHINVFTKAERIEYAIQYYYFAEGTDGVFFQLAPGVISTITMLDRGP